MGESFIVELRRPFMPASIGFKIQTSPQKRGTTYSQAMTVAFINARHVASRLNVVVPDEWEDSYFTPPPPLATGMECALTVCGKTRRDIGFSSNLTTDLGVKTLYSDAFKRAGVKWGIGEFLYSLPRMYVKADQLTQRGDKWFMPDGVVKELRGRYATWLSTEEAKQYGAPLDHGDAADAQGDVEEEGDGRHLSEAPAEAPSAAPAGQGQVDAVEYLLAAILGMDARALKPAEQSKLKARALKDEDEYKAVAKELAARYSEMGGDVDGVRAQLQQIQAAA